MDWLTQTLMLTHSLISSNLLNIIIYDMHSGYLLIKTLIFISRRLSPWLVARQVTASSSLKHWRWSCRKMTSINMVKTTRYRQSNKANKHQWVLDDAKHGSEPGCRFSIFTGCVDAFWLASCGRDKTDIDWQLLSITTQHSKAKCTIH